MPGSIPNKNLEANSTKYQGPLSSTGKACYSHVQPLEGYHKIVFLLLWKRGMCLLCNGSVIIRLSTSLCYLSSFWMLRKSWEEIDGIIPLCKKPWWWGCTDQKEEKKGWDKKKLPNDMRDHERIGHFEKHSSITFAAFLLLFVICNIYLHVRHIV